MPADFHATECTTVELQPFEKILGQGCMLDKKLIKKIITLADMCLLFMVQNCLNGEC